MSKKLISVLLAVLMLFALCVSALAAQTEEQVKKLQFNADGKFTVVHLTDVQDDYPMYETTKQYIREMLQTVQPDLVVLGGDNTVGSWCTKQEAIQELCNLFVENQTYFTLVFGNHDHQQNIELSACETKEIMLEMYREAGQGYCLAYDAVPELSGVATHNLPIYSSDGEKVAFNLFMMDSNTYYGNDIGDEYYDSVHPDQIEWYKQVANSLKAQNGGKVVHSIMFQHIIVQEIYDYLFIKSPVALGKATENFETKSFTYLPTIANLKSGYLLEKPCPGYVNYGQLDAMVETGDVLGIFSGHDHTNDFTVDINGINVTNTAGCTFNSYGDNINRGARVIVIDENDTSTYETYTLTLIELAAKEGSQIIQASAIDDANPDKEKETGITEAKVSFYMVWSKIAKVLVDMLKVLFFFAK